MRAKSVNENLNFERGKDPLTALAVGSARGGESLLNMIYEVCRNNPEVFIFPKSITTATGWLDWRELSDGDGSKPLKYFKLVMKEMVALYKHREISIILMESGNVYYYEENSEYHILKDLSDFWKLFNKEHLKKRGFKKIVGESVNFERGKDPKSAMSIGRSNLNYFQNHVKYHTPLEQLLKEMIFTNAEEDDEILEKAAEMLGVERGEVRIACNKYDEPIYPGELIDHYQDHDWKDYRILDTSRNTLLQSSTLEIYVTDKDYNDLFLMLLGAIY
jgi:hypothetical protein